MSTFLWVLIWLGIFFAPTFASLFFFTLTDMLYEISNDPIFRIRERSGIFLLACPVTGHILIPLIIMLFVIQSILVVLHKTGYWVFKLPYRLISKDGLTIRFAKFVYKKVGSIISYEF